MRNGVLVAVATLLFCASALASPQIEVEGGLVVGESKDGILSFKGIPYAAPPVGKLRWMPPASPIAWQRERAATQFGPSCMQPVMQGLPPEADFSAGGNISEDCLTLNVWVPEEHKKSNRPLPVMVFIHGGAHLIGSSAQPAYDGAKLARHGVVFVSFNYRVGNLGYFAHPALSREAASDAPLGNYGLMDQIAALKWVKRNIAAFGGDPDNITTFGESSGATDQLFLLSIPLARGLISKAIIQSSSHWLSLPTLKEAETDGSRTAASWGLNGEKATAEQLRALPADKITVKLTSPNISGLTGPLIDGRLLPETPLQSLVSGRFEDIPVIIGFNTDEGAQMDLFQQSVEPFFAAYKPEKLGILRALYADEVVGDRPLARKIYTDALTGATSRLMARYSAPGKPTFLYLFSYVPENQRAKTPGSPHGGERVYVFDAFGRLPEPLLGKGEFTPQDHRMAEIVQACWISFAKTGIPQCPDAPAWPAYSATRDQLLELGPDIVVRQHFRKAKLDFQELNFDQDYRTKR